MDSLVYQVQSLNLKLDRVMAILETRENEVTKSIPQPSNDVSQWVDLREAQRIKGGYTLNTMRTRPWLQPMAGTGYSMNGRKRLWPRIEVERWAKLTAEELYDYCASYNVEAPATYKKLADTKKRREALLA